ncbi:MAG: hypothetical protein JXA22_02270 [Candidatus Thermoplasmatota archaeon]|nr:hypothetical protein [Candidatus Thermoplasmatota archaeon]
MVEGDHTDHKGHSEAARLSEGSDPEAQHGSGWYWSLRSIVVLSTDYDRMIMEEEDSLTSSLNLRYSSAELDFTPLIEYVGSEEEAIKAVEAVNADLLIVVNRIPEMGFEAFAGMVRSVSGSTALAYLTRDIGDLCNDRNGLDVSPFLGPILIKRDSTIPHIIQLIEDTIFLGSDLGDEGLSRIVIISIKDPHRRHLVVRTVSDAIWGHICRLNASRSSMVDKVRTFIRRPRMLVVPEPSITGGIIKALMDRASISITDTEDVSDQTGGSIFRVSSGTEGSEIIEFIEGAIGPTHDLKSLEMALRNLPQDTVNRPLYYEMIRPWLIGSTEFELVRKLDTLYPDGRSDVISKGLIIEAISGSARLSRKRTIMEFSREFFDREDFSKIGSGQLGGKGRGLAFLKKLISEIDTDRYEGLNIRVPRTVVLASDVFDLFMRINKLDPDRFSDMDDARITEMFLGSDLPNTITGDIRHFTGSVRSPIVVRSSSLLEDALMKPFAGIYASVMLSNSSIELDKRFMHLCMGIKYVYSSTFHARALSYIDSTDSRGNDEKMAVIIQEVVGQKHGDLYYPSFSGVARSFDYWPYGGCSSKDGTVHLAVGLGKMIVEGGSSHKFCPKHPRSRFTGSPRESMEMSQRCFYALKKGITVKSNEFSEDVQMVKVDISTAESDGIMDLLASTYSYENDRLYPGTGRDGPRVMDFAPILQMGTIPLAAFLDDLLTWSEAALGTPVEIEFAVNLDPDDPNKADLYLLQLRGMRSRDTISSVDIENIAESSVVARSGRTLGNGAFLMKDVVMVKDNILDARTADPLVQEIGRLNTSLVRGGRPYLLLGPGRWGSCDPWLGIPVSWDDISGVRVIAERPVGDRSIDPSQGSHFFQNISSLKLGYLTFSVSEDAAADWTRLVKASDILTRGDVQHLRLDRGFNITIDGSSGKGIIHLSDDLDGQTEGGHLRG